MKWNKSRWFNWAIQWILTFLNVLTCYCWVFLKTSRLTFLSKNWSGFKKRWVEQQHEVHNLMNAETLKSINLKSIKFEYLSQVKHICPPKFQLFKNKDLLFFQVLFHCIWNIFHNNSSKGSWHINPSKKF